LLDSRLLCRKLDICIKGTQSTLFHNGRYENHCGFIVLKKVPIDVNSSVMVKIGYTQSQKQFQPRYLIPQITTENPPVITREAATPLVLAVGCRVVIIGADLYGNSDLVGCYGCIVNSGYALPVNQAFLLVVSQGPWYGRGFYFHQSSLCRSLELESEV
jgi:hypothetical protein